MIIRSAASGVLIDLAVNAPPDLPASATPAGPTLAPEELAGNKLLALFDRAAARDFADMIATIDRFTDSELPMPDGSSAAELREFYTAWRSELTA
jgi:hypothetical protein